MQVVLIMLSNGGERRSFSVVRNTTTVGRREDCDLRIPVGDVSRKHCRLVLSADNVRIQDLGSSNGTFVNGQQVQDAFLSAGDTVSVGPVNFVVQIDGVPGDEQFDAAPVAVSDTGAGGTALALDALTAGAPAADVSETDELLEEVPPDEAVTEEAVTDFLTEAPAAEEPVVQPLAAGEATIDEVPADSADAVSAFDRIELDDAAPAAEPEAADPGTVTDDWDFLIEEPAPDASHVDLHIDLDQPHDHHPPA